MSERAAFLIGYLPVLALCIASAVMALRQMTEYGIKICKGAESKFVYGIVGFVLFLVISPYTGLISVHLLANLSQ